jgi:hypothetical protein
MSKDKAFVDTTVYTDRLLKTGVKGESARKALNSYKHTELPVYAIKEFKAGPLKNFAWMHNTLVTTNSFWESLAALQRMSLSPHRYITSTALEALMEVAKELRNLTNEDLTEKYGKSATKDAMECDMYRYAIKQRIHNSWKRRRRVTTAVVQPLSCYPETELFENRGLIKLDPVNVKCNPTKECCLGPLLRKDVESLKKLRDTIDNLPQKAENLSRRKALHEIIRKPKQNVSEDYCRALGDAYFALFCPDDAAILTTNTRDHEPLAKALDKEVHSP